MSRLATTPRNDSTERNLKRSSWSEFLRRLAFWKADRRKKLDNLFIDAVNDLHPEWEKRRLERKATPR